MSEITERMREIAIAGLEADLRESRDRIAAMRVEWGAEIAALTERMQFHVAMTRDAQAAASVAQAQARHAEDLLDAAKERIAELEAKIDALRTDGVRVLIAASQPAWDA